MYYHTNVHLKFSANSNISKYMTLSLSLSLHIKYKQFSIFLSVTMSYMSAMTRSILTFTTRSSGISPIYSEPTSQPPQCTPHTVTMTTIPTTSFLPTTMNSTIALLSSGKAGSTIQNRKAISEKVQQIISLFAR